MSEIWRFSLGGNLDAGGWTEPRETPVSLTLLTSLGRLVNLDTLQMLLFGLVRSPSSTR